MKFTDTKGSGSKEKNPTYAYKDGENRIRLHGDVLARYVYWVKGENNKDIPVECLSFDRKKEAFTNVEHDYVKDYFKDLKCSWAYAMQCTDVSEGADRTKVLVLNGKKKLFQQIITAAEDLGDPTDPDTGWDVVFRKKKTGPKPINVEYELQVLKCKTRPLDDVEREALKDLKSMDELYPRATPEQQKEFLEKLRSGAAPKESVDESIDDEFSVN